MPFDVYLNVAVGGVLTGLVYGLMALGLSVIFGVVRVVNFAHGEMMTIAMYIAMTLFSALHLDPLIMLMPIAAVMFALGYACRPGSSMRSSRGRNTASFCCWSPSPSSSSTCC